MFATFNKIIALTGVLATLVLASPSPEPQSPDQVAAYGSSLASFLQTIPTNPALLDLASSLADDPPALTSLEDAMSSLMDVLANGDNIPSTILDAFPTAAQSLFSSIINAEVSIATANGLPAPVTLAKNTAAQKTTSAAQITNAASQSSNSTAQTTNSAAQNTNTGAQSSSTASQSTNAARPTGNAMLGVSAGAVAGFIGAVAFL